MSYVRDKYLVHLMNSCFVFYAWDKLYPCYSINMHIVFRRPVLTLSSLLSEREINYWIFLKINLEKKEGSPGIQFHGGSFQCPISYGLQLHGEWSANHKVLRQHTVKYNHCSLSYLKAFKKYLFYGSILCPDSSLQCHNSSKIKINNLRATPQLSNFSEMLVKIHN